MPVRRPSSSQSAAPAATSDGAAAAADDDDAHLTPARPLLPRRPPTHLRPQPRAAAATPAGQARSDLQLLCGGPEALMRALRSADPDNATTALRVMCKALERGKLIAAEVEALMGPGGLVACVLDGLRRPAALRDACALLETLTLLSRASQEWLVACELPTLCALLRGAADTAPSTSDGACASVLARVGAGAAAQCLDALAPSHAPALLAAGCAEALVDAVAAADRSLGSASSSALLKLATSPGGGLPRAAVSRLVALAEAPSGGDWMVNGIGLAMSALLSAPRPRAALMAAGAVRALAVQLDRGGDRGAGAAELLSAELLSALTRILSAQRPYPGGRCPRRSTCCAAAARCTGRPRSCWLPSSTCARAGRLLRTLRRWSPPARCRHSFSCCGTARRRRSPSCCLCRSSWPASRRCGTG